MPDPSNPSAEASDQIHAWLEVGDEFMERAEQTTSLAQRAIGPYAYRQFKMLQNLPMPNVAGNFRGMVLNKRAKIVYHYIGKGGDRAEHFAKFLAIAAEIKQSSGAFERIIYSSADRSTKVRQMAFETAGIGFRLLGKKGTSLLGKGAFVLRNQKYVDPICWFSSCHAATNLAVKMEVMETKFNSALDQTYTGEHIEAVVTQVLSQVIE